MRKLIKERHLKAGYVLRTEEISGEEVGNSPAFLMTSAFTLSGEYIGNSRDAYRLVVKRGIKPVKARASDSSCSIGWSEKAQKWYGWSHRAIYGFGIGDVVSEGDCTASEGWTEDYLKEHPEERTGLPVGFIALTLEDAKKMAIAFAANVS